MKTRQQWCAMLAKLVAPMDAANAGKAITGILPMLNDFPDSAFTVASLEHVANNSKFVPNYHELRALLGEWWKAHRPQPTAIEHDKPAAMPDEHRSSWATTLTPDSIRRSIREIRNGGTPWERATGYMLAGAIRRSAPEHLGILPPEWLKDRGEPADVIQLRKPPPEAAFTIRSHTKRGPIEDDPA